MSEEDKKEIIYLWKEGFSMTEIENETGYSRLTVADVLAEADEL